ncbi:helix-turn-helix domain-containing protein [[Mycoplasma] collis]|uniref:helix-turn-helix domain-containing protein n=1 Tax=[Mycoplasma] collis TaxID=2127 RepID=UPI00068BB3DE|nr:helix-turn-helix domain-containing protein [[Mycoplasma] collis]
MEKNINNFFHLNQQNRLIIEKLLLNKWSHRRIAKKLGVSIQQLVEKLKEILIIISIILLNSQFTKILIDKKLNFTNDLMIWKNIKNLIFCLKKI